MGRARGIGGERCRRRVRDRVRRGARHRGPHPASLRGGLRSPLEQHVALVADGSQRADRRRRVDLATGQEVAVLGDQRFPMASTSKIAIAATFLEGVEQGRWSLTSEFPLMVPVASARFSSAVAPVAPRRVHELGRPDRADDHPQLDNPATDALLAAVGGPSAVNDWARRAGIARFQPDPRHRHAGARRRRDRPGRSIDMRDSATPRDDGPAAQRAPSGQVADAIRAAA